MGPAEEGGKAGLEDLASRLKVLSNGKRLQLVRFLAQPRTMEDIVGELGLVRQTVMEHLELMEGLGLVERVRGEGKHGPITQYRGVPARLYGIQEELRRICAVAPPQEEAMRRVTAPLDPAAEAGGEKDLPRVSIVHGLPLGRTIPFSGDGPWLLGRDPGGAVCLDYDPFVSTRHAEVRRIPGGFEVADLYSRNGTFVDWTALGRGGRARIATGSILQVGGSVLVFRTLG